MDLSWFTPELEASVWKRLLSSKDKQIVQEAKDYLLKRAKAGLIVYSGEPVTENSEKSGGQES